MIIGAITGTAACGQATDPGPDLEPVWLRVSTSSEGPEYWVDDQLVERDRLEQALLDQAMASNLHLTQEQAQAEVPIYVRFGSDVTTETTAELIPLLQRFNRAGLVAEDRR